MIDELQAPLSVDEAVRPNTTVDPWTRLSTEIYLRWLYPDDDSLVLIAYKPVEGTTNYKGQTKGYDGHTCHGVSAALRGVAACETVNARAIWCSVHQPKVTARGIKWSSGDIARYQFLPLDLDNKPMKDGKPRRVCATDEERKKVRSKIEKIKTELSHFGSDFGLPSPSVIFTGNGYLLLYPIDLEVSATNHNLMARLAAALAAVYNDEDCGIDTGVIQDPSRILGVVGTMNRNKAEVPEEGRFAKQRAMVEFGPRENVMRQEAFIRFATAYCEKHDTTSDCFDNDQGGSVVPPSPRAKGATEPCDLPPITDDDVAKAKLKEVALSYLSKCEPAIEGRGGDLSTFRKAGHLLSFRYGREDGAALNAEEVSTLMAASEWNGRCEPPWTLEELRVKVSSAMTNGTARTVKIVTDTDAQSGHPASPLPTAVHADDTAVHPPDLTIDLSEFPPLLGQAVAALSKENRALPAVCHVIPCFAVAGVLIGKAMFAENMGQMYYPNIWTVIPCPTNSNKSGSRNLIQTCLEDTQSLLPNKPTAQALYAELGRIIDKKTWAAMSRPEKDQQKSAIRSDCRADFKGRVFVSDECTGTLKRLMGLWDTKAGAKDIDDVLNLSDPTYRFESPTVGDGFRCMYDLCVSFIGFTQDSTWQTEMASTHLKDVGMFGRIIPNTRHISVTNLPVVSDTFQGVARKLKRMAGAFGPNKIKSDFGVGASSDFIRQAMDELEQTETIRYFKRVYPSDWGILYGKVIGHAIKVSMICAFLNSDFQMTDFAHDETVCCRGYFKKAALLVVKCFLSYLDHADNIIEATKQEAKVFEQLAKHGYLMDRDLSRAVRLYGSTFREFISGMMSTGEVGRIDRKSDESRYVSLLKSMGRPDGSYAPIYYLTGQRRAEGGLV